MFFDNIIILFIFPESHLLFFSFLLSLQIFAQFEDNIGKDNNLTETNFKNLACYIDNSNDYGFDWTKIETKLSFEDKKEIILKLGRQDFYNNQLYGDYKDEYASHYHFFDINNDSQLDIIYNGADGADCDLFMIWLNIDGIYQRICWECGEISDLTRNKNGWTLFSYCPSHGGGWIESISKYQLFADTVEKNSIYSFMDSNKFPAKYSDIGYFEINSDLYNLRTYPTIENEPCEEYPNGKVYCGNIYMQLKKGIKGKAISEFKDETGRVWWFSIMEINKAEFVIGWLSNRYVNILNK